MIKAVLFDTFGTIVDWRSSIALESAVFAKAHEILNFDGDEFARRWRAGYRPGMAKVTTGERPWVSIDVIHRERLEEILPQFTKDLVRIFHSKSKLSICSTIASRLVRSFDMIHFIKISSS